MKVEYKNAILGEGHELHIPAAEYKRVNSEAGWNDHPNLIFAVNSYLNAYQCINRVATRDLEEAYRHIKKTGTIALVTRSNGEVTWCEIYAITEGAIIPVITGIEKTINYSAKTRREQKNIQKLKEGEVNE
jgi:hypothetical protein